MARATGRKGRIDSSEDGASDIAFLILFLLLFALVNVREGDPAAPRIMATAPIFDLTDRASAAPPEPQSWVLVRIFEGGLAEVDGADGCEPLGAADSRGAPGTITVALQQIDDRGQSRMRELGAMRCTTGPRMRLRLRQGLPLYAEEWTTLFSQMHRNASVDAVILEINRELPFQYVVEAGEALRRSLPPGAGRLKVRYRGFPPGAR